MDITTILSTVLILGPGYLIRLLSDWIEQPVCDEEATPVGITITFIFSFVVLIINIDIKVCL